ncbi:MAG: hypothetical protein QJR12_16995 [Mycobacterium sp.]|uniref:hypothetical protein n=1 Tax=Mycobacterium sp. TaxID=1785 RepID=UPI0026347752|nr:hypothetical protein [Mycobacterium sp.]MDI3315905.1 hypothetical protein [Mycobacterium sp.]
MSTLTVTDGRSPFDRIKQTRPDGSEFWSARQLQSLMAYGTWERFSNPLQRAIQSASNTGIAVDQHFRRSVKKTGGRPREDYELSRYAAYLVAMNGDPNKPEVAAAQSYFAERTRQAEVIESELDELPEWARQQIDTIRRVGRIEVEQQRQAEQIRQIDARVASVEGAYDEYAALGYARLRGLPTDRSFLVRLGRRATDVMRAQGQEPRKRKDATFGLINIYPEWALDEALADLTA